MLTAKESFWGFATDRFTCLLAFTHYKPQKWDAVNYAAVFEWFQLYEGGDAAWVFPVLLWDGSGELRVAMHILMYLWGMDGIFVVTIMAAIDINPPELCLHFLYDPDNISQ